MSHRPAACDHVWSNWDYEPDRAEGGILIRRLTRQCYLCNHVEEYGQAAPRDEH